MSEQNTPPTAIQRWVRLLAYVSGIGLLLFILFTIVFSLWSIATT